MVEFNRAEAQRRAEQYYTQLTLQIKERSWVLVLKEWMPAPEGDHIPNRKLSFKWAGPFKFEGMAKHVDEEGQVIKSFVVHASNVRLYKCPQQYDRHRGPLLWPGKLADFDKSESSISRMLPPNGGASPAPPSAAEVEARYSARNYAPCHQQTHRQQGHHQKTPSGAPLPLSPSTHLPKSHHLPKPTGSPRTASGPLVGPTQPRGRTTHKPV